MNLNVQGQGVGRILDVDGQGVGGGGGVVENWTIFMDVICVSSLKWVVAARLEVQIEQARILV